MEQRNRFAIQWIDCSEASGLVPVACRATEAEVALRRPATSSARDDVIDLECHAHQALGGTAERTTASVAYEDSSS
jgi:hypothetical protein